MSKLARAMMTIIFLVNSMPTWAIGAAPAQPTKASNEELVQRMSAQAIAQKRAEAELARARADLTTENDSLKHLAGAMEKRAAAKARLEKQNEVTRLERVANDARSDLQRTEQEARNRGITVPAKQEPAKQETTKPEPAKTEPTKPYTGFLPALWRNDEYANDQGRVVTRTQDFCQPVELSDTRLKVSEFFSHDKDSAFENLRSSDKFDSTGANIKALLPQGSLVLLLDSKDAEYRKVRVVSRGRYSPDDLREQQRETRSNHRIANAFEEGYLHKDALKDLRDYKLLLEDNRYLPTAKSMGMDIADTTLALKMVSDEKIAAIRCKTRTSATEDFMIFDITRRDADEGARPIQPRASQIAISANMAAILVSATAQGDDESDDDEGDNAAEDPSGSKQDTGGIASGGARAEGQGKIEPSTAKSGATQSGNTDTNGDSIAGVKISGETPRKMICLNSGNALVRTTDSKGNIIDKVQFTVGDEVEVIPRQGFEGSRKPYGKKALIEVQFPKLKKSGWVNEEVVMTESECKVKHGKGGNPSDRDAGKTDVVVNTSGGVFPTFPNRPLIGYTAGNGARGTYFGAKRTSWSKRLKKRVTRKHAACDLIRNVGDPAKAIMGGTVIQGPYDFYEGTFAVEVKHDNGKIVRYGEVSGRRAPGIHDGARVKAGQIVGYIKRVAKSSKSPMLHFEMYAGTGRGPLTQGGSGFFRRSDLMNPTTTLKALEANSFK